MLLDFIHANRAKLITRSRAKSAKRSAPAATDEDLPSGVPFVLDQLAGMLGERPSLNPWGPERSAARHGAALLMRGYTVAQVVLDYGDICQAITELAHETDAPISTDEFQTLNRCLDNSIAEAMTEYTRLRDQTLAHGETERSGVFAHELRNKLSAASLAFQALTSGRAPMNGSVSAVLGRSLQGMTTLLDRALVEVRLDAGNVHSLRVHVHQLLEDAEIDGTIAAAARSVIVSVATVDLGFDIEVDPHILAGVVANLLQNAIKFTPPGGRIVLRAKRNGDRVEIEVEDECGGLPPGKAEELFDAFEQRGTERTGLGLGLFISRKGVEASGGSFTCAIFPDAAASSRLRSSGPAAGRAVARKSEADRTILVRTSANLGRTPRALDLVTLGATVGQGRATDAAGRTFPSPAGAPQFARFSRVTGEVTPRFPLGLAAEFRRAGGHDACCCTVHGASG